MRTYIHTHTHIQRNRQKRENSCVCMFVCSLVTLSFCVRESFAPSHCTGRRGGGWAVSPCLYFGPHSPISWLGAAECLKDASGDSIVYLVCVDTLVSASTGELSPQCGNVLRNPPKECSHETGLLNQGPCFVTLRAMFNEERRFLV